VIKVGVWVRRQRVPRSRLSTSFPRPAGRRRARSQIASPSKLDVPYRDRDNPELIGESERIQIIRSLLRHDTLPLPYRIAGCLITLSPFGPYPGLPACRQRSAKRRHPPRREDGVCDGEWTAVRGLGGRAVSSDGARSSVLSELIGRELAMLRAAAAGRGEFLCGSESALAIDVYWCDFSLRAPPGTRGVAAPGRARRPGERVSAEITPACRLALASGLSGVGVVVAVARLPGPGGGPVDSVWRVCARGACAGTPPWRRRAGRSSRCRSC
jgi:hypothetical protein